MFSHLLMLFFALVLSGVAGFYSVIGMTTIFASSFLPVLIMTAALEGSKVITASWLYNNWNKTPFLLKSYLTAAVVVLMFITSLGIFGFLSKAHVEQAAAGAEQAAQIEKINKDIAQQNVVIERAKQNISRVGSQGQAGDEALNKRIEDANRIIESASRRAQPQIDEQQRIIDNEAAKVELRAKSTFSQIEDIDKQVANLDNIVKSLIDQKRTAQATARQQEQQPDRTRLAKQKAALLKTIDDMRNAPNPPSDAAKAEIARIRAKVDDEVKQARETINSMTSRLGQGIDSNKMQAEIEAQEAVIKAADDRITQMTSDRFKIESESRKLEAEVGPIKYIAQALYGDQIDQNLLEHAVRWIIVLIIAVFDPMAVLMLVAANHGIANWRAERQSNEPEEEHTVYVAPGIPVTETRASDIEIHSDTTPAAAVVDMAVVEAMIQNRVAEEMAARQQQETQAAEFYRQIDEMNQLLQAKTAAEPAVVEPVQTRPSSPPPAFDMLAHRPRQVNHTFAFDAATNTVEVSTDGEVQPEPLVRPPVEEDEIEPVETVEEINEEPVVTAQTTAPASVNDLFDVMREKHRQRIAQHGQES